MRFKTVILVNIKVTVFWNLMLYSLINRYQSLYPEHGESRFLQIVDTHIYIYIYHTTQGHFPEQLNFKSCSFCFITSVVNSFFYDIMKCKTVLAAHFMLFSYLVHYSTLKMETVFSFTVLGNFCQTSQCCI